MSTKTYLKLLIGSFLFGIGISFVGCAGSGGGGSSSSSGVTAQTSAQTNVNCATGSFNVNGLQCVPGPTFEAACQYGRGQIFAPNTLLGNSVEVCRSTPILNETVEIQPSSVVAPGNVNGTAATIDTNVVLFPGDHLATTVQMAGYCQGTPNISDGVTVYALSEYPNVASSPIFITHTGSPIFGFSSSSATMYCPGAMVVYGVARCVDASGATHQCQ